MTVSMVHLYAVVYFVVETPFAVLKREVSQLSIQLSSRFVICNALFS